MIRQYVVDAFTDELFRGNQAAICVLDRWLPEETMMNITLENNFSETAFTVREGDVYRLRWFTPGGEIDLCGHATLACAFVLLNHYELGSDRVVFHTMSGELTVLRQGDLYEMNFPAYDLRPTPVTPEMTRALGAEPSEAWLGRDLLMVLDSEETVRRLSPDMNRLSELDGLLQHVTARSAQPVCSAQPICISRSFAPKLNVNEDPVCGSGHCHIIPLWAEKLGITTLTAYQASRRGGTLYCRLDHDRVILAGKARLYSIAELQL